MGGTLVPETTPGGGLTMVLTLPVADAPDTGTTDAAAADRAIVENLPRRHRDTGPTA